MGCCSGRDQTRRMDAIITFRPNPTEQFQLKVQMQGRNGSWKGRGAKEFDFGSSISCGDRPPIGVQNVTMKVELVCTEVEEMLTVGGFIDIRVAKHINRFNLPSQSLDCPNGGPGCSAEWPALFFNQYLGTGTLTIHGRKTPAEA